MDPITRVFVITGAFLAIVATISVIYRRVTGKPFITFHSGRPGGQRAPQSDTPRNKQMSPLFGGALSGAITFAYFLYKSGDVVRALLVGGAVFAVGWWVMWAGRYLERRTRRKREQAEVNE